MSKRYNIAVVGVGSVGREMLRILKERNFPIKELRILARSSREIEVDCERYDVAAISPEGFEGIDIALFAGTEGEKGAAVTYAPQAVKKGSVVIDNGADFRMEPDVPLIVPEINAKDIKKHKGIIANPNCSTIQMVLALWPIYKVAGIERVIVCSYQAVSGAGRGGVVQLEDEIQGRDAVRKEFAHRIAKNVIPQIGEFGELDYTSEEWKMVHETRKIMHDKKMKISATCVRVPVLTGHSEAVYLQTKKTITAEKVRRLLSEAEGVTVVDGMEFQKTEILPLPEGTPHPKGHEYSTGTPQKNFVPHGHFAKELVRGTGNHCHKDTKVIAKRFSCRPEKSYPLPIDAQGKDDVFVGRIRRDPFVKNGLWLWVVSDNLRKGAALNAVQIAECVISP